MAMTSILDSYNATTAITSSTAAYPTSFTVNALGSSTADVDLLLPSFGGGGDETKANNICLFFTGDAAGTATIELAGQADGGVVEHIATIALTFTDVTCAGAKAATSITVTDTNLAQIIVADSGNSRPARIALDVCGLRYLKMYYTSAVTTTTITPYIRYF